MVDDFSRHQLVPAEQQRVGHLSKWVQVDEPHPALQKNKKTKLCLSFLFSFSYIATITGVLHAKRTQAKFQIVNQEVGNTWLFGKFPSERGENDHDKP